MHLINVRIAFNSSFLDQFDNIIHGDLILADQGFDISEDLALKQVALETFPFIKRKSQLYKREVETSQILSYVRIHAERAGGQIKYYKILQNTFLISLMIASQEDDYTAIDKILIVCATLCKLQPPLVDMM